MTTEYYEEKGTAQKAWRLHSEGRVRKLEDAQTFVVVGDHDTYLIVLNGTEAFCSCPSTNPDCSHVRASKHERGRLLDDKRVEENGGDPFEGLV